MYVAISGQAGTGKSTLVPLVAAELGIASIIEDTQHLPAYIAWLEKRGTLYDAQQQFLQRAYRLQQGALSQGVQERAIYENYEVIVRYYHASGLLSSSEFDALTATYLEMRAAVSIPDLLVHLTAPIEVLLERHAKRGKVHDLTVDVSEITKLEKYYKAMFASWKECPIYIIDTSRLSVEAAARTIAAKARSVIDES